MSRHSNLQWREGGREREGGERERERERERGGGEGGQGTVIVWYNSSDNNIIISLTETCKEVCRSAQ